MPRSFDDVAYVRIDLTAPGARQAINVLESQCRNAIPANRPGVNMNAAETVAWVKAPQPIAIPASPPVTRVDNDNRAALAEIYQGGWYPEV